MPEEDQMRKPSSAGSQITEKADTASDHNNSMITAISADRETEKSSPVTSPFVQRKPLQSSNKNDDIAMVNTIHTPDSKFSDVVLNKSKEINCVMKEIVQMVEMKDEGLSKFIKNNEQNIDEKKKIDWKTLVELSESIFNDYSKEMEDITKEFDDLNKVCLIPLINLTTLV